MDGDDFLEVDADVEKGVVAGAFWHALGAQRLQAGRAVLDGMVGLLGLFWVLEVWGLYPLVVQRIKLLQRCGRTIIPDGVAHGLVPAKIRQVEEVAGVPAVHEDCSLLGENLPAGLAQ